MLKKQMAGLKKFYWDNLWLVIFKDLCILLIYLVKIVNGNIGVDTERYIQEAGYPVGAAVQNGRIGQLFLEFLYPPGLFSVYTFNLLSVLFLCLSATLWVYLFSICETDGKNKKAYLLFFLFYVASGVWVEVVYFTPYAVAYLFTVVCCPILTYATAIAICQMDKKKMILCVLSVFCLLIIYQAILPMWIGGTIIYLYMISKKETISVLNVLKQAFFVFILLLMIYAVFLCFTGGISVYLLNKTVAGQNVNYKKYFLYLYSLFFSNIRNAAIEDYFVNLIGESLLYVHSVLVIHSDVASMWFLPLTVSYYVLIIRSSESRFRKILLSLCPLTVLFFPVMGGGYAIVRSQWTIPLSGGVMCYYVVRNINNKKLVSAFTVLSFVSGLRICERSAVINYIDQLRYEEDVRISYEIDNLIREAQTDLTGEVYVWVKGRYMPVTAGYELFGEMSGNSIFGWNEDSGRAVYLMNTLGFDYSVLDRQDFNEKESEYNAVLDSMPSYPAKGYVRLYGNVAFVKFSD